MSKLLHNQFLFSTCLQRLIKFGNDNGYEFTFGEVYRTDYQQKEYIRKGLSKTAKSLHLIRLAADLNIFYNGQLLKLSSDILPLGNYWKSLSVNNVWGGDFNNNGIITDDSFEDPSHFQTNNF